MTTRVTADSMELVQQAGYTADDYMRDATERIDRHFGEGYATAHPELVGRFMQTAALDLLSTSVLVASQNIEEAIREASHNQ